MKNYLDEFTTTAIQTDNCTVDLNTITGIIFPDFFEWDGCVLLERGSENPLPPQFSPNQFIVDRTAFEADYNHVHLNDFFDEDFQPSYLLKIGIKILDVWAAFLYKKYNGNRRLILILSFDGEEVVLRFYTARENELQWIDVTAIESYLEGIIVAEI